MSGVWIEGEKLEACPCCGKSLDQAEYDFQWCRSCQLVAGRGKKKKRDRITISVLVPAGVKIKEVIGIGHSGVLETLEIVSD